MKTLVVFLLSAGAAFSQVVQGRYVVELSGDPAAVASAKQGARFAASAPGFELRRAAVRFGQMGIRGSVEQHGGTVIGAMDTVLNALVVNIPDARAAELSTIPGVLRIHTVHRVRPLLNHALPLLKVPDAWAALPLGRDSAGLGIKIGMIDSGVDVNNPAFSDPLPPLAGFPKVLATSDQKFTNAKIIVAKNYTPLLPDGGDPDANDRDGHGTGTALAAAGGPAVTAFGTITGVAPKAYIGSYKVLDVNGATSDVVAMAIDDAVADGMDVINISLGAYVTSYSDISLNEVGMAAIEAATAAGVIVAVAAGNSGPGTATISDYASAPDAIAVGAIMNDRALGYAITAADGTAYEAFTGSGANPGQVVSGPLMDVAGLDPTGLACSPLPAGSAAGMVVLVLRGICTFETKINDVAAGGALAAIVYNNGITAPFASGAELTYSATLPTLFLNQADGQDLKARLAANPAIAVTMDFVGATEFPARPDLTYFSSRGPSFGTAMKPDLVAVGEEIVTGAQNTFSDGESYDASGFIDTAGTSFSAPLAAGTAAVLKSARPGLTVAEYRSLLINNASPASTGPGVAATVQQAGGGLLNVAAALAGTVAAYPTSLNFGTGAGSINQTLNLTLTNIGAAGDTYSVTVVPSGSGPAPTVSTANLALDPGASQQLSLAVSASGLAPGEYQGYVQVSGTANQNAIGIPYWFAVPGSAVAGISVLYQDVSDSPETTSSQAVVFRVMDIAGLPFSGAPAKVTVTSGDGLVRAPYRVGNIPGTYAVDVRLGTQSLALALTAGGVTQNVVIPVH